MKLKFSKMHGLGNDFVVIDGISQRVELSTDQYRHIADRQAPLPRLPKLLRSAERVLAHGIQALLSRRRLEGLRAVRDGWQDARTGRLGRRP